MENIKVIDAFNAHLKSDRFFKILVDNIDGKVFSHNIDIGNKITLKCSIGIEDLRIADRNRVSVVFKEGKQSAKPIGILELELDRENTIFSNRIYSYESLYFLVWMISDTYVSVCELSHAYHSGEHKTKNLEAKKLEVSDFMNLIKNPFHIL